MKTTLQGKTMFKILLATSLLFFIGCGRDNIKQGTSSTQTSSSNNYNNTHAYDANGPYAKALEACVLIDDEKNSCTLAKLPLLGQESYTITKEMIMQRVLVSHQWMGDRFSQMLDKYSNKMIQQLFRATTAIVIDDDIIPAYYWAVTGAIYLDPRYLWLTANEKATITNKEDFRSDFGSDLQFLEATFFRINNNSLYTNDKTSRTHDDIERSLAGLLYHELAHANDFVPPSMLSSLNSDLSILENIINIGTNRTSEQLIAFASLQSTTLKALGPVLYKGENASASQKQLTGVEAGNLFDDDVAAAMYAYSTPFEDTAMLFQSAMMKYFYNVDGYQIFFNAKTYQNNNSIDMEWGIKNPVLKQRVLDRAVFVSNRILPINGEWAGKLHGITDSSARLATSPALANTYISNTFKVNENEFQKMQVISLD